VTTRWSNRELALTALFVAAEVKSQDAVYVLAYSVIMLNTDLHNPQVRVSLALPSTVTKPSTDQSMQQKRMDITAYSRNLRGVNDGVDFAPEYLVGFRRFLLSSVLHRSLAVCAEIHLRLDPETRDHPSRGAPEPGWIRVRLEGASAANTAKRLVLLRLYSSSSSLTLDVCAGPFQTNRTNEFDRGMFAVAWKPIVSAMSFAFASFQDDFMVQRAIGGFNQCAALAARFGMPEVFDYLILSLSRVTGLTQASPSPELGNFPVVDVELGQKVTVSPLAVRFGMNVKAQLAAVVLFTIANNNGASIREGWSHIFEIYQTLFVHSLLPPSLLAMEDFLSGESVIPLKPKSAPAPRDDRRGDGGLLSTLSSYLLSPYGASDLAGNDYTDDDVETTLSAVDCIASCQIEQLYSQILCVPFLNARPRYHFH
jgi:brefeldin A-resistance guanine nucleotide exchange factor 1